MPGASRKVSRQISIELPVRYTWTASHPYSIQHATGIILGEDDQVPDQEPVEADEGAVRA